MKYARLSGFEKHLQGAAPDNFSQIYLIVSKEEEERKIASDLLVKALVKGLGADPIIFSAKKVLENEIFCELETLSFLQPKKLIHICDAQSLEKTAMEKLANYFTKPLKSVYLILSMSELMLKSAFYKNAEKHGVILEIQEEKPWEKEKTLQEFLLKEVASEGKKMAPELIQMLIKGVGTDSLLLQSELKKLFCFVGERTEITREDMQAVCLASSLENAWQLGEALFNRKATSAFKIVRGILAAQEVHFLVILKQLRTQFQTAFQVGSSSREVLRQDFPTMKDFVFEKNMNYANAYGLVNFATALKVIDEVEFMAKNGMDRYDLLADLLVFKLITI